jgi:NAD(P)-dependent dehydrogenase (short-subunit alcohol dehydrogenase family)
VGANVVIADIIPERCAERAWRRIIDLNFLSMLAATSAATRYIIEGKRGGSIINVASIEGSRAAPNYSVYAACKAGMLNFTRSLALELADHGIRVNAIAPDFIVTPGLSGNLKGPVDPALWTKPTAAESAATARRIPLGRAGVDDECGSVAVFLASKMSAYVTGGTIPVDGGSWASSGWLRNKAGQWTLAGDIHIQISANQGDNGP